MPDMDRIDAGITRAEMTADTEIDDGTARTIAALWHSPGRPLGAAFSSTGAIADPTSDTWRALFGDRYDTMNAREKRHADWLGTYLLNAGPRGPVDGWSNIWAKGE